MHVSLATELPRRGGAPPILESQSCFSCTFGDGFDATVVNKAASVEDDCVDASRFCALAYDLSDRARPDALGCIRAGSIDHLLLQIACRDQCLPSIVVNHLGINMRG